MFLRQTFLYLPAQIIGPFAQVVAAIVWTHWLAPGPYGLLTFLIASQDLLFLVCLSWWTQFTFRYLGSLDGSRRESFLQSESSVFMLTFGLQIVATLLVLMFLREPITPDLARAAIFCIGTRSLLTHLGERARVQSRIGVYTIGQIAGSLAGFALAYGAVAFIVATPDAILWSYALAQFVGIVIMWRCLGVRVGHLLPSRTVLRAAFAYGVPLLVAGAFAWLAQNGIRVVVEQVGGTEALGLIAVGWGLGQRLAATLAMLAITASFPLAVKTWRVDKRAESYHQLSHGGLLLVGLILPASIGLCFLAEPFVTQFVAAPFRETTIAILPYAAAAGVLRNIRMHIADPVFLLMEQPRINTGINLFDAICSIGGCWIGFATGGLVGAVAGCLVGTIVCCIAGFVLAKRLAGFDFPYAGGAKIALASVFMAVVLAALPWETLHLTPIARMMLEATIGACVYAVAIACLYPAAVGQVLRQARRWSAAV